MEKLQLGRKRKTDAEKPRMDPLMRALKALHSAGSPEAMTPEELERALPISRLRIDAAERYLKAHPDIPAVLSGGQGPGEDISEADCMADWLIAHGVDESRIYREDRSTSTQENFAYSEEIMAELGLDAGDTFAFVTNDYHIFRAGRIAGTDAACGVAATLPRSAYYDALQLNYYVREAFATGWLLLRGN